MFKRGVTYFQVGNLIFYWKHDEKPRLKKTTRNGLAFSINEGAGPLNFHLTLWPGFYVYLYCGVRFWLYLDSRRLKFGLEAANLGFYRNNSAI